MGRAASWAASWAAAQYRRSCRTCLFRCGFPCSLEGCRRMWHSCSGAWHKTLKSALLLLTSSLPSGAAGLLPVNCCQQTSAPEPALPAPDAPLPALCPCRQLAESADPAQQAAAVALGPGTPAASARECRICMQAADELLVLVPCGHRAACAACTALLLDRQEQARSCPICRTKVWGRVRGVTDVGSRLQCGRGCEPAALPARPCCRSPPRRPAPSASSAAKWTPHCRHLGMRQRGCIGDAMRQ